MKRTTVLLTASAFVLALAVAAGARAEGTTSATKSAAPAKTSTTSTTSKPKTPKIDINSAPREDLMKLPGVGEATADKIIAARPFKSKDELVAKNIVTKSEYQKISSHIVAHHEKTPTMK